MTDVKFKLYEDEEEKPAFKTIGGSTCLVDTGAFMTIIKHSLLFKHPGYVYIGKRRVRGYGGPGERGKLHYWREFTIMQNTNTYLTFLDFLAITLPDTFYDYSLASPLFRGRRLEIETCIEMLVPGSNIIQCNYLKAKTREEIEEVIKRSAARALSEKEINVLLCQGKGRNGR